MPEYVVNNIQQLVHEDELERLVRFRKAWYHYYAMNELPIAVGADQVDDNVRINLAKMIVDKGVSWLFGADRSLGFGIEQDGDSDDAAADLLDQLWPLHRRSVTFHQLGVNGGVCGHVFLRLLPDERTGTVRVVVWDPSNVVVKWDPEDIDNVLEFVNTWSVLSDKSGVTVYARRQRVVQMEGGNAWEIVDEVSEHDGETWEEVGRELWPYEWSPVFHCQNLPAPNEFWGSADLEVDVLDLIDAIMFVAGYARKLVRHRGHPLPYIVGEEAKKIAELNVALGRMLVVPSEVAKIGQLESGDLGATLDLYNALRQALQEVSRMPSLAFGTSISNVAEDTVELAFAPAVEKTWDKRITYGPMLSELTGRILELGGKPGLLPQPQWGEVVPRSARAEADALERDLRMGIVSKETIAEKRGYDWEVESARISDEKEESAARLGMAFAAGMVDEEGTPPQPPAEDEDEDA